ncbi:TPA: hypothetical protein PFE07_004317 [Kluyvera cryocrescens]|nr:hypothetical protein [Kluyvera cryocrescens]
MANSIQINTVYTYDLDGVTVQFNVPFEYLSRNFVVVTLVGQDRKVLTNNTDYIFINSTTIQTLKPWGSTDGYQYIEVRRETSATDRLVDFQNGSVLRASDLNVSSIQSMHIAEEARDLVGTTMGVDLDGNLDARGKRITNVVDGVEPGDVVTVRQQQSWSASALNQANRSKSEADRSNTEADRSAAQATSAMNQATAARNSATIATIAQTSASNSASTASSQATVATNAASTATSQVAIAINAQNSSSAAATAAASSAAAAATANPDNQLKKAQNLSDVSSISQARTNLSVYSKEEVDKKTGRYVGEVLWHTNRSYLVNGTIPGDGQLLSRTVYADLFAEVVAGRVPVVSELSWFQTPANRGSYTLGDGSTTFRVPDYNGKFNDGYSITAPVLRGDGGLTTGIIQMNAVPNITGVISRTAYQVTGASSGVFARDQGSINNNSGSFDGSQPSGFSFDASRSSPAYGRDSTTEVRMNAVVGCYVIVFAGAVKNEGSIDALTLATDLASLTTRVIALEGERGYALIQTTSNMALGSRVVLTNPFGANTPVITQCEILHSVAGWTTTPWLYATSSNQYGVTSAYSEGEGIILRSGATAFVASTAASGASKEFTANYTTPSPIRVHVWKTSNQ